MPNTELSLEDFIAKLDEATRRDTETLLEIMKRISGQSPKVWNAGTIGFDSYHYKYSSGREGDGLIIGFYPRKNKITVYLMDGTAKYSHLLARLGAHTITGYCIYVKHLVDIDISILTEILTDSYTFIKNESKKGPIDRILWQTEK